MSKELTGEKYSEFFQSLGNPRLIVAPMVDQSDLAFRMLTRKYGADLCFTQMFNANSMMNSPEYFEVVIRFKLIY